MTTNILNLCEVGNLIGIKKYLNDGVDCNIQNNEGDSPLQVAAANGHLDLVSFLLKSGASVDLQNNYGWTPLMHAAKYGHALVVDLLIKSKAKVNIMNKLGISAVVAAACSGSLATVKLLIEAGAMVQHMSAGNEVHECDLSTLMAVSYFGYCPLLEYLVQNGGIADHSSPVTGLTPLMLAVCGGHKEIVSSLIKKGVDYNAINICGQTALDYSCDSDQLEMKCYFENLVTSKPGGNYRKIDLFQIIKNGDVLKIKSILERDQHLVNSVSPAGGITPLMVAAKCGLTDVANLLVSSGASLDDQDTENGWTPLMHALSNGHEEIVKLLLNAGASIQSCSLTGCTALELAQQNGNNSAIIEMLTAESECRELKRKDSLSLEESRRWRLSVSERPSKRSLSQTRVKEWIGGVAQHLQNKMLTLRSPKHSENVASVDSTLVDESFNEVFMEQTATEEESSTILPPNLYLANCLKEHKVEAIVPPFPPMSTDYETSTREIRKKSPSRKSTKCQKNFLRLPHLLKSHTGKKQFVALSKETVEKAFIPYERSSSNETRISSSPPSSSSNNSLETAKNFYESLRLNPGSLTQLLSAESLQKYAEIFRNQEIDIETFLHLTEADLQEIGIENTESQRKLMEIIKKLQISK